MARASLSSPPAPITPSSAFTTPRAKSLLYLDPSVDRDSNPVWSPDGKQIAFIRIAATTSRIFFGPHRAAEQPWSIRLADVDSGKGRELWHAAEGPGSAFHAMVADNQLFWGAGDRIVFPWEHTGWMHLYSISTHGDAPTPLNTNGEFEIEHVSLSSRPQDRPVLFQPERYRPSSSLARLRSRRKSNTHHARRRHRMVAHRNQRRQSSRHAPLRRPESGPRRHQDREQRAFAISPRIPFPPNFPPLLSSSRSR